MNAISAANVKSSPPTSQIQHELSRLQKQDTDSVLSSLLASLEPPPSPPESLPSIDPREFDSQWESGYSDNEATPDSVSIKSRQFFKSGSSPPAGYTNIVHDMRNIPKPSISDAHEVNHTDAKQLSSLSNNGLAQDNSNGDKSSDDDDDNDDDIDIDDEDVFDMLRDNSQLMINMLNEPDATLGEETADGNKTDNQDLPRNGNSLDEIGRPSDVPPPIPTTPLPSDDDEPPVKPPLRVESLPKFSGNNSYSTPVVNGTVSGRDR